MVKDMWAVDWCELDSEEWIRLIKTTDEKEAIKTIERYTKSGIKGGFRIRLVKYIGKIMYELKKDEVANGVH